MAPDIAASWVLGRGRRRRGLDVCSVSDREGDGIADGNGECRRRTWIGWRSRPRDQRREEDFRGISPQGPTEGLRFAQGERRERGLEDARSSRRPHRDPHTVFFPYIFSEQLGLGTPVLHCSRRVRGGSRDSKMERKGWSRALGSPAGP